MFKILQFNKNKWKKKWEAYYYLLPCLIILISLILYPLIKAFGTSLQSLNFVRPDMTEFVGLRNYISEITSERTWNSLKVTFLFTGFGVLLEFILGFFMALFFNRDFKGKTFFRSILLIPIILSPVVVGLIWRILYNPDAGMINYFLGFLGIKGKAWLAMKETALISLIITDVWQWTPFMFLMLLAGLEGLSQEHFDAAKVDGASGFNLLRYITIPLLKPIIIVAILIRIIDSLRTFDLVFIMTSGGPGMVTEITNYYIYQTAFRYWRMGSAASIAIIFTAIVTVFSLMFIKYLFKTGENLYE